MESFANADVPLTKVTFSLCEDWKAFSTKYNADSIIEQQKKNLDEWNDLVDIDGSTVENDLSNFPSLLSQFIDWIGLQKRDDVLWYFMNGGSTSEVYKLTIEQLRGEEPLPKHLNEKLKKALEKTSGDDWKRIFQAINKLDINRFISLPKDLASMHEPIAKNFGLQLTRIIRLRYFCTGYITGDFFP